MNSHAPFLTRLFQPSLLMLAIALQLPACGFQQYFAKPIDPQANIRKFEQKDPASAEFQQFLASNGYSATQLPIQQWTLNDLTYCALFFHPSLDVARAQWRAATVGEGVAAQRPLPTVNVLTSRSNQANQDIRPYLYGLSIDIPLETANKRAIRIENAQHLSEAAKLEIAQTAWQLRQHLADTLNEYHYNQRLGELLATEVKRRQEIVAIYQKRVDVGMQSNVELSTAKLQWLNASAALQASQQNQPVLLAKLADSLGLSVSKVALMQLATPAINTVTLQQFSQSDLQSDALLNRLDIRAGLEKYAAAEARLKLEIAKQYPDLSISPGYAYEFGDKVWSLGLSGLLTLLNKNKVGIAEATQLREVEAAQFETLQTKVIGETAVAKAQLVQAISTIESQQSFVVQQQQNSARMQRRLDTGEADRLELTYAKLEDLAAQKNAAQAEYQLLSALNKLENTLQRPYATDSALGNLNDASLNERNLQNPSPNEPAK